MVKRVETSRLSSRATSQLGGISQAVPAGVTGILRRFWDFSRKMAQSFGKQLKDPEQREQEFINIVRRDADRWT